MKFGAVASVRQGLSDIEDFETTMTTFIGIIAVAAFIGIWWLVRVLPLMDERSRHPETLRQVTPALVVAVGS